MRLSRETVQIRIAEMRDAINDSSDTGRAIEEANRAESRLLSQLALQNRMDEHAPEMLEALKGLRTQYASAMRLHGHDVENDGNPYIALTDAVIAKIEKE